MDKAKESDPKADAKNKSAGYIEIDANRCKGCYLCITSCPRQLIEIGGQLNIGGYYPAVPKNAEGCTACGLCWQVCPDVAICVYKHTEDRDS